MAVRGLVQPGDDIWRADTSGHLSLCWMSCLLNAAAIPVSKAAYASLYDYGIFLGNLAYSASGS